MTPRGRGLPLQRDASIPFATSDGSELLVPVWRPEFEAATETLDLGPWTYNVKPQLLWRGTPLVAELLIARILIEAGWAAAWVDGFAGGRRRTEMPPGVGTLELPNRHQTTIDAVRSRLGRRGGHWDVIAFSGDRVVFVESKGPGDSINQNQRDWLAAAMAIDVPRDAFWVVEWRLSNPAEAERVRIERRSRLKPSRGQETRTVKPRSTKKRWRPLEHELKDRLSPDYQAAVTRKASEFRIGTFTLVMDNSLRRIPAKGYVRVSRNRPLIDRGLAKGDPSNPQITALGKRLIAELDRELGSDSYPVDALE